MNKYVYTKMTYRHDNSCIYYRYSKEVYNQLVELRRISTCGIIDVTFHFWSCDNWCLGGVSTRLVENERRISENKFKKELVILELKR